ncbi:MAG: hypothetical protein WAJ82_07075, partial [Azonexus sp.]
MVNAIHIISAALGAAFLLGVLKEEQRRTAYAITLAAFAFMSAVSAGWLWAFVMEGAAPVEILTAGGTPPFVINLRMALPEAALTLLANLTGLLSAIYLKEALFAHGRRAMAVLLIAVMALSGII